MKARGVLLVTQRVTLASLGVAAAAALLGATASCSAPDPGLVTYHERAKAAVGDAVGGSPPSTDDAGATNPSGDPVVDAGADGAPAALVSAFDGAGNFDAAGAAKGSSDNASHAFLDTDPPTNPSGQKCLDCHVPSGSAPEFGIGASVYTTATGANSVDKAQIRLVDATGKELANVYVDGLGNFWSDPIAGGIPAGSKVGVRNGTVTKPMIATLAAGDGNCNKSGCHIPGAQGRIYLQ